MSLKIFKSTLYLVFFSCFFIFSQNLKTPDVFTKKTLEEDMQKFYNGKSNLENESVNSSGSWIVYSDRENNYLYRNPGPDQPKMPDSSGKSITVGFFDAFYVREIKYVSGQNYLKIHKIGYENQIYGWVNAKTLVLSQHCLLTDISIKGSGIKVPVPKKGMILVSLGELKKVVGPNQIAEAEKNFVRKVLL